jgi:hypothetical protein
MKTPDFYVKNCFSLILLMPESKKAEQWAKDNIYLENWQDNGQIAVEPRFFDDLYEGIKESNLTLQRI